jgi:hypothetical protein
MDEVDECGRCESIDAGGVGNAIFKVGVVAELKSGVELGLAE